jgi:hypothetical protein
MDRFLTGAALLLVFVLIVGAGAPRSAFVVFTPFGQVPAALQVADHDSAAEALFRKIEEGISSGNVAKFSQDLARQTYVSVRGKESGYFSANQAFLILRNFFSSRRLTSFRLSKKESAGSMPFATGGGTAMSRGSLETLQVYIALTRVESRWVIEQFNVY